MRAVARAADVDAALVYHYYGSKERLLDAATTPPQSFLDRIVTAWQTPTDHLGEELVRQMLENWQNLDHAPVIRAIIQIAGNEPAAREKVEPPKRPPTNARGHPWHLRSGHVDAALLPEHACGI